MAGKDGRRRRRELLLDGEWEEARRLLAAEMAALGVAPAEAEAAAARKLELARRRIEWGRERLAAFMEMQERAGEAYMKQIEAHPDVDWEADDAPQLPDPPEEAAAQAIYAELMAAINEDRWPRHLHDSGL
jgi:hypothetical protein